MREQTSKKIHLAQHDEKLNLNTYISHVDIYRAGTPGASYDRTRREQESQEDREARLDRQRLRTNHLMPV